MSTRYTCYYCSAMVYNGVGHSASCPTRKHHEAAQPVRCDCGSPDAHWQFCRVFVPYEKRVEK